MSAKCIGPTQSDTPKRLLSNSLNQIFRSLVVRIKRRGTVRTAPVVAPIPAKWSTTSMYFETLSSQIGKLASFLQTDKSASELNRSNTRGSRTAEWVDDKVAGLAGAENDRADEGQWELSGEVGQAFVAVFDEARDAPDVVPKFAVGVGS